MAGTAAVVNAISKDALGIGYGGAAYGKGVKRSGPASAARVAVYGTATT